MRENLTEVVTGTVVLAIAALFLTFALQRTGGGAGEGAYALVASFRSADGVAVGTDVRLAGVKVGSVTALELNPTTFRAEAEISLRGDVALPDDSAILISSEGLLGGNFVEIQPGGSPFNFEPGDEVTDTQGAVSLISLLLKFVGGSE